MQVETACSGGVCGISPKDLAYQEGVDHFYGAEKVDYPEGSPEAKAFDKGFKDELEANVGIGSVDNDSN